MTDHGKPGRKYGPPTSGPSGRAQWPGSAAHLDKLMADIRKERQPVKEPEPHRRGRRGVASLARRKVKRAMTAWSRHLDGTDEHRCERCYIAFPQGKPLCGPGKMMYDASHPEQAKRQG